MWTSAYIKNSYFPAFYTSFSPSYPFSDPSPLFLLPPFFPSPLFIFNPPSSPFSPQLIIGRFAVSLASMFVRNGTGGFWGSRKKVGFEVSFHHVSNTYHLLHQINMASESSLVYTEVGISIPLTLTLMHPHPASHPHLHPHFVIPTLITLIPYTLTHMHTSSSTPSHPHIGTGGINLHGTGFYLALNALNFAEAARPYRSLSDRKLSEMFFSLGLQCHFSLPHGSTPLMVYCLME